MNRKFDITTIIPLKYLRATLLAVVGVSAIFFLLVGIRKINLSYNTDTKNHYLASIIDKINLLDSIESPKIVLMGGNSVAFGLDSDLLSKELEMPVINLALDSNLGSSFMVNLLKSKAKKGDVVVMMLDYNISSEGDRNTKLLVSDFYEPANDWIKYQSFFESVLAIFFYEIDGIKRLFTQTAGILPQNIQDKTSLFFRKGFNEKGDLISHLNNPNIKFTPNELVKSTDFGKQVIDLNEFDIFAKKQGINFVYTFPSYSEGGFEKNMIIIQKIEQQLRQKAKFNIIGTSQSSVLDDTLFFNNEYNLNSEGRKIFTSRVLQLLEQEGI